MIWKTELLKWLARSGNDINLLIDNNLKFEGCNYNGKSKRK